MSGREYDRYGVRVGRPHLVLLGAGASLAAFPNGDRSGLRLPLMNNVIQTVTGLSEYLHSQGIDDRSLDFEVFYSSLYGKKQYDYVKQTIEHLIYQYFAKLQLPDEPTLYDHIVLSLTGRDVIATFNWDPFLWQAVCRNQKRVGHANMPHPLYLHGNTAIGVCLRHDKIQISHRDSICHKCYNSLDNSRLLYPVAEKDYNTDPFIKSSWVDLKKVLQNAYMFTIFGYSAPTSDVEAVDLLSEGWGDKYERSLEQIEIIDMLDESILKDRWDRFLHTHHFGTHTDFYESMLGKCSRRSVDACFGANINCVAWEEYPIPKDAPWQEIDVWLKPYIEAEKSYRISTEHVDPNRPGN